MKIFKTELFCSECDIDFTVKYKEDEARPVKYCPFCRELLDEHDIIGEDEESDEDVIDWPTPDE